jgi:oxygen-dependent protoporphyrinogen oxidase
MLKFYPWFQIADYIIDPMCRGMFAGDIKKLSIKSCLPMVYNLEENSGSIVKGLLFSKSKWQCI